VPRARRDPSTVEAKLVALVRELSRRAGRPATDEEARAALAPLSAGAEHALLNYAQGEPPAKPLGPMAWADIAQGTPPQTAAARELTGYYSLLNERDALAQVLRAQGPKGKNAVDAPKVKAFANANSWDESDDDSSAGESELQDESVENEDDGSGFDEPKPKQVKLDVAKKVEPKPIPRDRKSRAVALQGDAEQASRLLTLFAYHRDTPLVAKALNWSRAELDAEVDRLGLKRKAGQQLRGLDTELPIATVRKGSKEAPVRRRSAKEKADEAAKAETEKQLARLAALEAQKPAEPAPAQIRSRKLPGKSLKSEATPLRASETKAAKSSTLEPIAELPKRERLPVKPSAEQGDELRGILREIGPRRHALAARLGSAGKPLSTATLLARFRAAGLEREFGQRERDLVRALVSRHRSALGPAAAELSVSKRELEELIKERGLAKEVEEQREKQRSTVRAARWPKARVAQFLERRDWLQDLGLYDEVEEDVRARTKVIWSGLSGETGKLDALAESLGLKLDEAQALAKRLSLI
jgi:hypothetical protein